jgi:dGTPase
MAASSTQDRTIWSQRLEPAPLRSDDQRDPYERDYARILHSHSFRKLSSKTQVLGAHSRGDFHRTRLSHSLEVAQIACGIRSQIKSIANEELLHWLPSSGLINACALAHDIGHAPFGHAGENTLNYLMLQHGGFESNGQALRIVSRLEDYSVKFGLNPTRRLMLGILKYPVAYSSVVDSSQYPEMPNSDRLMSWEAFKPPKCYLDSESNVVDFILEPLTKQEQTRFVQSQQNGVHRHKRSLHKSLDCSIIEIADDIAFGVHDLEDAIYLNLISKDTFLSYFDPNLTIDGKNFRQIADELFSDDRRMRKYAIGFLVHYFVTQISSTEKNAFESPILKFNATITEQGKSILEQLIQLVFDFVISNRQVQMYCYSGCRIVADLFEIFANEPKRFLHTDMYKTYKNSGESIQVICDYLAGMTDDYAKQIWRKMFSSDSGSIFDTL